MAILATGACSSPKADRDVSIRYDQVANFLSYRVNPDDPPVKTPGAIFVMYRITEIENTGIAAMPTTFGKHKILAGAPGKISNEEPAADQQLLGDKLLDNLQVEPGKVAKMPGCIIKTVQVNSNTNVMTEKLIPLAYETDFQPSIQKVKMRRDPADNVTTLVTQATSTALRSLC